MRALAVAALIAFFAACPTHIGGVEDAGPERPDSGIIECSSDTDCNGSHCVGGVCSSTSCTTKHDCGVGLVCEQGQCTDPPSTCGTSADCPGSQTCDAFSFTCSGAVGEGEGSSSGEGEGEGEGASIDLSSYKIEDRESGGSSFTLPSGTSLFAGHSLVIGRSAQKTDFESFWGQLPASAFYKNGNGFPIVNGGEKFALVDNHGNTVDGPTFAGTAGKDYQRTSTGSASSSSSWSTSSDSASNATPGSTSLASGSGLKITEWSDASTFDDEFIEISYLP
jgi:hypothetical protein